MTLEFAIPLAALIVSLATLIGGSISLRHKADITYTNTIEGRLAAMEKLEQECLKREEKLLEKLKECENEKIDLMKKLLRIED